MEMNAAQGLLIVVIVVLTTLLVFIGIQVANILKEIKKSLEKINKILDDAGTISNNIAKPISDFSNVFKLVGLLVDFVKEKKEKREKQKETLSSRHFFLKNGKKLSPKGN